MVSLIFSHLFTSLILKGIVITTPTGRGFRITPREYIQNIPSCHLQSVLREQPLSFSLAYYYAPATIPSALKHAKLINISRSFAPAGYTRNHLIIQASVQISPPQWWPPQSLWEVTLCLIILLYFLFSILSLLEIILFVHYLLLLIRTPKKQGFELFIDVSSVPRLEPST